MVLAKLIIATMLVTTSDFSMWAQKGGGQAAMPKRVIRLHGNQLEKSATMRVRPRYPPLAQAATISGSVLIEVTVARDGTVASARPVEGHSMLKDAALEAVRAWRFAPIKGRGHAEVVGTIRIRFELNLPSQDNAISFYKGEVESKPDSAYAHLRLGLAYRAAREFQTALEELNLAVDLDTQSPLARYELGDLLSLTGAHQKAISELKEAIRINPGFTEAYCALASAYITLKNYEQAIGICRQAAIVRPDLDVLQSAYGSIAMVNKFMERKEERIDALRRFAQVEKQLLEINPEASVGPQTWLNQAGDLSQEVGRNAEAKEAYKESISVNHDYQETYHAYLQLAALSKKLGRSDEAEKYYDQIAELTSKRLKDTKNRSAAGDGYYRLGIISERRGRDKEALGLYLKAAELRQNHARTHRALARLYSKAGNKGLAQKETAIANKLQDEAERELDVIRSLGEPGQPIKKPD